ncbi:MAG: hypothetical protein ABJZ03_00100 [Marinomonas sp.]
MEYSQRLQISRCSAFSWSGNIMMELLLLLSPVVFAAITLPCLLRWHGALAEIKKLEAEAGEPLILPFERFLFRLMLGKFYFILPLLVAHAYATVGLGLWLLIVACLWLFFPMFMALLSQGECMRLELELLKRSSPTFQKEN